jgi:hypothetical protein
VSPSKVVLGEDLENEWDVGYHGQFDPDSEVDECLY